MVRTQHLDSNADEDSINRIRFVQENVYGKMMELANLDKVQGIIIRLRQKGECRDFQELFDSYVGRTLEERGQREEKEESLK